MHTTLRGQSPCSLQIREECEPGKEGAAGLAGEGRHEGSRLLSSLLTGKPVGGGAADKPQEGGRAHGQVRVHGHTGML